MKKTGSLLKTLMIIVVLGVLVVAGWRLWKHFDSGTVVNDYRSCVAAGNPVQESYPEVCNAGGGKTYPNPANQVHQAPGDNLNLQTPGGQ